MTKEGPGVKMTATELVRPDVPISSGMQRSDSTSIIGFMSDVHVGSKTFLSTEWGRMIDYLKTDAVDLGMNYLLIPGDVVDGIGIYPDQEKELDVDDIYEQYHVLAEYLKEIPELDPTSSSSPATTTPRDRPNRSRRSRAISPRCSIPTPSSSAIRATSTSKAERSSPIMERASTTSCHRWVGLNYSKPIEAMKEMLKRRHPAPMYGGKTPLAPEPRDMMVIDTVPDIFVTGHVAWGGAVTLQGRPADQRLHLAIADVASRRCTTSRPDPAKLYLVHLRHRRDGHAELHELISLFQVNRKIRKGFVLGC